jgi:hypothetical protein
MATIKKETQDYTSRCSAEAKKMLEDIQLADHDVGIMEREVAEVLKVKILILIFLYNSKINCILTTFWEKALIVAVYVLNVYFLTSIVSVCLCYLCCVSINFKMRAKFALNLYSVFIGQFPAGLFLKLLFYFFSNMLPKLI